MRQVTIDEARDISNRVSAAATALITAAAVFAVGVVLVRVFWAWTVPDILPLAVEQGLIAATIGWLTAVKITAFAAILGTTGSLIAGRWSV